MANNVIVEDGQAYKNTKTGEKLVMAQWDGYGHNLCLVEYYTSDGSLLRKEDVNADELRELLGDPTWQKICGGCVAGHVWGKFVRSAPKCPDCGSNMMLNVDDHRRQGFYPQAECLHGCENGWMGHDELKQNRIWKDFADL